MKSLTKFVKKWLLILVATVSIFSLSGCNPDKIVIEKYSETVSQGLYAAGDALLSGRVDLAELYIENLEKIIPLPLNRLTITPVIYNGIHYVILNDRERSSKVIVVGDADFQNLLKLKVINAQQQKDADAYQTQAILQAKFDAAQISALVAENAKLKDDKAALQKEVDEYHSTIEYKIKSWIHWIFVGSWFGIPLLIIGVIALVVCCPAALPVVLEVAGSVFGTTWRIIKWFFSTIGSIFTYFNSSSTK